MEELAYFFGRNTRWIGKFGKSLIPPPWNLTGYVHKWDTYTEIWHFSIFTGHLKPCEFSEQTITKPVHCTLPIHGCVGIGSSEIATPHCPPQVSQIMSYYNTQYTVFLVRYPMLTHPWSTFSLVANVKWPNWVKKYTVRHFTYLLNTV